MPTLPIQEKKDLKKGDAKEVIRVSISEAARLFGVNPQTIRRAIRDQDVTYVVVAGRYKINFESLVKWSQRKTTVRNKSNQHGIGQFIDRWKISNTLYSPSTKTIKNDKQTPGVKNQPGAMDAAAGSDKPNEVPPGFDRTETGHSQAPTARPTVPAIKFYPL